jgi:hypothetical protein
MTAATTKADEYWHRHCSACRYALIYAHTTSLTLPTCNTTIGAINLTAPEAREIVELILLHVFENTNLYGIHKYSVTLRAPNLIPIGKDVCEVQVENSLHLEAKMDLTESVATKGPIG